MKADDHVPEITTVLARTRYWLIEKALPLWLDRGFDPDNGMFHERLGFNGRPVPDIARRLMVQARQIYVFRQAEKLGWIDGGGHAETAFQSMISRFYEADGKPGFIFSVDAAGELKDASRDLYGHAFALFACAWDYRMRGQQQAIEIADAILIWLDRDLGLSQGGYLDGLPDQGQGLRQNPHMHLFEALLELFEATQAPRFLDRANAIFGLFERRFFQADPVYLPEYYDREWHVLSGVRNVWEPGHHFEWCWLLDRLAKLGGGTPVLYVQALYERACHDGIDARGRIPEEIHPDGSIANAARRVWPLTEAVKAHAVIYESSDAQQRQHAAASAAVALHRLQKDFLSPDGLWIDQLHGNGAPASSFVPASTLYHIVLAVAEATRVWG